MTTTPVAVTNPADPHSACSITNKPANPANLWGLTYIVEGSQDFTDQVYCILNDGRSWAGIQPAKPGTVPDFKIIEIEELEAQAYCGSPFDNEADNLHVSCASYSGSIVVINEYRFKASNDLLGRVWIVNHEIGHELGYQHDKGCSVMAPHYCGVSWPAPLQAKLKT